MLAFGHGIVNARGADDLGWSELFDHPHRADGGGSRLLVLIDGVELRGRLVRADRAGGDPAQDFTPSSLAHGKTIKSDFTRMSREVANLLRRVPSRPQASASAARGPLRSAGSTPAYGRPWPRPRSRLCAAGSGGHRADTSGTPPSAHRNSRAADRRISAAPAWPAPGSDP